MLNDGTPGRPALRSARGRRRRGGDARRELRPRQPVLRAARYPLRHQHRGARRPVPAAGRRADPGRARRAAAADDGDGGVHEPARPFALRVAGGGDRRLSAGRDAARLRHHRAAVAVRAQRAGVPAGGAAGVPAGGDPRRRGGRAAARAAARVAARPDRLEHGRRATPSSSTTSSTPTTTSSAIRPRSSTTSTRATTRAAAWSSTGAMINLAAAGGMAALIRAVPSAIITSVHEEYQDADLFRFIPPPMIQPGDPVPPARDVRRLHRLYRRRQPCDLPDPGTHDLVDFQDYLGLCRRERAASADPRAAGARHLDHPGDPRAFHRHRGLHLGRGRARRPGRRSSARTRSGSRATC